MYSGELYPGIISIKRHVHIDTRFDFAPISAKDIDSEIGYLDPKKNGGWIPTMLLKEMRHIVSEPLAEVWNSQLIKDKTFSSKLKLGDITPVFKSLQNTIKKNYRPITVLVVVSKMFEKIMDKQINDCRVAPRKLNINEK